MMNLKIEKKDVISLDNTRKLTNYQIERIQDSYIFIKNDEFMGVATCDGKNATLKEIVKPDQFNTIGDFDQNGCAIVSRDGKYGLISQDGSIVIDPEFQEIEWLCEDLYEVVKDDNHRGLVNLDGKYVIPLVANYIRANNNVILIHDGCDEWVYNRQTKKIIDSKFSSVYDIVGNKMEVFKDRPKYKTGVADIDGNMIINYKYNSLKIIDDERLFVKKRDRWYLIDYNEKVISKLPELKKFKRIFILHIENGCFLVGDYNLHFGLMDFNGHMLTDINYTLIHADENGHFICELNEKYERLISSTGEILIDTIYASINCIADNVYQVKDKEDYQLVNQYNQPISNKYDKMENYNDKLLGVVKNNKYGVINTKGEELIKPIYDDGKYDDENSILLTTINNQSHIYSLDNDSLTKLPYIVDSKLNNIEVKCVGDLILIKVGNEYTVMNRNGKVLADKFNADSIHILNNHFMIINNYLINVEEIKMKFILNIMYGEKTFNESYLTKEERENKISELNNMIERSLNLEDLNTVEQSKNPKTKRR